MTSPLTPQLPRRWHRGPLALQPTMARARRATGLGQTKRWSGRRVGGAWGEAEFPADYLIINDIYI